MKKIVWLLSGVIFVAIAFFIPGRTGEIWDSLLYSGIAAVLYLIIFTAIYFKKIPSTAAKRMTSAGLFGLVIIFTAAAIISYQQSKKQEANLTLIRATIEAGIAKATVNEALLKTLESYYNRTDESQKQSLAAVFYAKYDSLIDEDGIYHYEENWEEHTLVFYVKKATPDSVVLIAQSKSIKGHEADFENYTGKSGLIQSKGILTSNGITYEREN